MRMSQTATLETKSAAAANDDAGHERDKTRIRTQSLLSARYIAGRRRAAAGPTPLHSRGHCDRVVSGRRCLIQPAAAMQLRHLKTVHPPSELVEGRFQKVTAIAWSVAGPAGER